MKRLSSSDDSLGAMMTLCPTSEEQYPANNKNHVYGGGEFQSMFEGLDDEACLEEPGSSKKRRLSVDQVKALEKNFEVENKLEPERKVKLAQELGLQPRQVAVWFQNRRARWKTKQLERDYGVLKANYDALKHNYDSLHVENQALQKEIKELKSKVKGEDEGDCNVAGAGTDKPPVTGSDFAVTQDLNFTSFNNGGSGGSVFLDVKDGSSDSDSSAILNEGNNSPNAAGEESLIQNHHYMVSPSSTLNCYQFSHPNSVLGETQKGGGVYQPQFVKIEEHNFFGGDEDGEGCDFFADDQAPTLQWYSSDQWS